MLAETATAQRREIHQRPTASGRSLVPRQRAVRARGRGTVARLLAAGLAEFGDRGYQAVTVDDIVRRAKARSGPGTPTAAQPPAAAPG